MTVKISDCKNPNTHGIVLGENYCRLCTKMEKDASEARTETIKVTGEEE